MIMTKMEVEDVIRLLLILKHYFCNLGNDLNYSYWSQHVVSLQISGNFNYCICWTIINNNKNKTTKWKGSALAIHYLCDPNICSKQIKNKSTVAATSQHNISVPYLVERMKQYSMDKIYMMEKIRQEEMIQQWKGARL